MGRPIGDRGWNIWRALIGGFYLASALFNGIYTVPLAREPDPFEGYAEGAWFGFLADFMRGFFTDNGTFLMVLVIIFEVAVGAAILNRARWVDLGVLASLVWVVAIMPFLAWPYLMVNVVLFVAQGVLLLRRFDEPVWNALAGRHDARYLH
jgi:hypothetical protein